MELKSVYKEILWKNNFASIPGLGSFVNSYTPAKVSPEGDEFIPPLQVVDFDTSRTFNDEALERYLQSNFGVSPNEAAEMSGVFIEKLKEALNRGEAVVFDNLGELSKDSKGAIIFSRADEKHLASSTYGLRRLPVSEVVPNVVEVKNPRRGNFRFLYGAVAAIVIVGLFVSAAFIFFSDFFSANEAETQSSKITKAQVIPEQNAGIQELDSSKIAIDEAGTIQSAEDNQISQSVQTKSDKKKALFYQEAETTPHKNFYIISGSYASLENAQKHYNQLLGKGFRPEIIQGNGRYRVAMVKFYDRNIALKELERIRQQNPNSSFWLLGI